MIMFLLTFTISGSGWVYGDSAFASVIGEKAAQADVEHYDSYLTIWQPIIASSTFPVCLLVGFLAGFRVGFVAEFLAVFIVGFPI